MTGLDEYQAWTASTANTGLSREMQLVNYALGLGGETGEFAELLAAVDPRLKDLALKLMEHASRLQEHVKKNVYHQHKFKREDAVKEAGDVLWYLARILDLWKITLSEVANANRAKLDKRYANGFSPEASKGRTE